MRVICVCRCNSLGWSLCPRKFVPFASRLFRLGCIQKTQATNLTSLSAMSNGSLFFSSCFLLFVGHSLVYETQLSRSLGQPLDYDIWQSQLLSPHAAVLCMLYAHEKATTTTTASPTPPTATTTTTATCKYANLCRNAKRCRR